MDEPYFERALRLTGEVMLQTVPPALLAGFAANELAKATDFTLAQAVGLVTSTLLICLMVNTLRD